MDIQEGPCTAQRVLLSTSISRESDRQFNAANSNSNSKTVGPNLTDQQGEGPPQNAQMTNVPNWNF